MTAFEEPAFSESSGFTLKSKVLVPEPPEYGSSPEEGPSNDTQLARSPVLPMFTFQSLLPSLVSVAEKVPSEPGFTEIVVFDRDSEHSLNSGTSSCNSTVSVAFCAGFEADTVPVTSQQ